MAKGKSKGDRAKGKSRAVKPAPPRIGLLDLPTEIKTCVAEQLLEPEADGDDYSGPCAGKDIINLSIVSKDMYEVCRPLLWKRVHLYDETTNDIVEVLNNVLGRQGFLVQDLALACGLDARGARNTISGFGSVNTVEPSLWDEDPAGRIEVSSEILASCSERLRSLHLSLNSSDANPFCPPGDSRFTKLLAGDVDSLAAPLDRLFARIAGISTLIRLSLQATICTTLTSACFDTIFDNKTHLSEVFLNGLASRNDRDNLVMGRVLASLPYFRALHLISVRFAGWSSLEWRSGLTDLQVSYSWRSKTLGVSDLCNRHKGSLRWLNFSWIEPPGGDQLDLPNLEYLELHNIASFNDTTPYRTTKKLVMIAVPFASLRSLNDAAQSGRLPRLKEVVVWSVRDRNHKVPFALKSMRRNLGMLGIQVGGFESDFVHSSKYDDDDPDGSDEHLWSDSDSEASAGGDRDERSSVGSSPAPSEYTSEDDLESERSATGDEE